MKHTLDFAPIEKTQQALATLSNQIDQQHGRIHPDQLTQLAQIVVDLGWDITNLKGGPRA